MAGISYGASALAGDTSQAHGMGVCWGDGGSTIVTARLTACTLVTQPKNVPNGVQHQDAAMNIYDATVYFLATCSDHAICSSFS